MSLMVEQPQSKRIKLEHSYAYDDEIVVVKEESVENDVVETIKIEINDDDRCEIKTEPVEEIRDFEYLNVPNDNTDQYALEPQEEVCVKTEIDNSVSIPPINNTVPPLLDFDPLLTTTVVRKHEVVTVSPNDILLEVKKIVKKTRPARNIRKKEQPDDKPQLSKVKKDQTSLRKEIKELQKTLKMVETKEKALLTELGERMMTERELKAKNSEMRQELLSVTLNEKTNAKTIQNLKQRLQKMEEESLIKNSEFAEKLRRDHTKKLEKLKTELRASNMEQRKMDVKCTNLIQTVAHLTTVSTNQKNELHRTKHKLKATENILASTTTICESLKKSLETEKNMSSYFVKERQQLVEQQEGRFNELNKKLELHKDSVRSLTLALNKMVTENNSLKEAMKQMERAHKKRVKELKCEMEAVKQQNAEFQNRTCQYCGL